LKKSSTDSKPEVIKAKKGTWYEPWMGEEIKKVAREGGHVAAMCIAIGIKSRKTFYDWLDLYPEFKEAYEESKLISLAAYENLSFQMAIGAIKGDAKTLAIILNNKFKEDYTRSASGGGTEINIGSINTIENLDTKALDDKIKKLKELIPEDE